MAASALRPHFGQPAEACTSCTFNTVTVTLIWALSLLLNNPQVLKKAKDELDIHVGKDRLVDESDINNLIYLQAIIKETLRLYPVSPLIALRSAKEDCTLSVGYHVPSGTRLMSVYGRILMSSTLKNS